jgi:ATP-dependent Clp protease adaptor protein ClpS
MDAVTQDQIDTSLDFPSLWGAKFLNDDYTPMDFVMLVLMSHFAQTEQESFVVMLKVHEEGEAVVGSYTKDIAETKVLHAMRQAAQHGHPLRIEAVAL